MRYSVASHHYTDKVKHIHQQNTTTSGLVTAAGSETLKITSMGLNNDFGHSKLMQNIWWILLFVGKLTNNPGFSLKYNVPKCPIYQNNEIFARCKKCEENLYRTEEGAMEKALKVEKRKLLTYESCGKSEI